MKSTGNMSVGKPIALQIIPLQKSTLGQSFLSMKQGSLSAILSNSIAISMSSSLPVIANTQSAIFFMIVARGSQFLYTLCPKPQRRPSFFLTLQINLGMFYFLPIDSSILNTASFAPPCLGPYRAPVAPAMVVYTSTPEDERCLTAAVEQLSQCSACKMNKTSKACTNLGCGLKLPQLSLSSIQRKLSTKEAFSGGLLYSLPILCLKALAAIVGTPPSKRQICLLRIDLSLQIVSPTRLGFCSGCKVENAATVLQMIPIGWASYLKEFIIVKIS